MVLNAVGLYLCTMDDGRTSLVTAPLSNSLYKCTCSISISPQNHNVLSFVKKIGSGTVSSIYPFFLSFYDAYVSGITFHRANHILIGWSWKPLWFVDLVLNLVNIQHRQNRLSFWHPAALKRPGLCVTVCGSVQGKDPLGPIEKSRG